MDGLKKKKSRRKKKALDHNPDYWYTESTLNEGMKPERKKKPPELARKKRS